MNEQAKAQRSLQIAPGWEVALLFLAGFVAALLNDKLCLAVMALGSIALVIRHQNSPAAVMGIVFSIACQVPFLRRMHDYLHGYVPSSPVLIASYCAYPAMGYLILRHLPSTRKLVFLPMVMAFAGLMFSYCVGVWNVGIMPASIQLLQYIAGPIVFGYLVVHARDFDTKALVRWILVVGSIEATYGLYQWVAPPPWDVAWFTATGIESSGGQPLPFLMRCFGTLNITSPYSYFLAFVLSVTVLSKGFLWTAPILLASIASTQARSSWGCLVIAWTITFLLADMKSRMRQIGTIGVLVLTATLMAAPFADRLEGLSNRLSSVKNIKGDNSFQGRTELVTAFIQGGALENPIGVGLGSSGSAVRSGSGPGIAGIDNGFLQTIWLLGWIGATVYLGGLTVALGRGLVSIPSLDPYELPFLAIVIALLMANVFESSLDDLKGVMVWTSLGVVNLAAQRVTLARGTPARPTT